MVPALALLGAGVIYLQGGRYVETDNAYVKADKVPISTEVLGRVAKVFVEENQQVRAGQPLFELDQESFRVAVAKAEAELAKGAHRSGGVADQLSRPAGGDRRGPHPPCLCPEGGASPGGSGDQALHLHRHYDDARQLTIQTAQQQVALEEGLKKIEASLSGDVNLPVDQQPAYQEAAAELAKARLDLARTTIYAPPTASSASCPSPASTIWWA